MDSWGCFSLDFLLRSISFFSYILSEFLKKLVAPQSRTTILHRHGMCSGFYRWCSSF
nr:MAG TPA: hypothetical protein [Caudoviricetes sp.]